MVPPATWTKLSACIAMCICMQSCVFAVIIKGVGYTLTSIDVILKLYLRVVYNYS